MKNILALLLIFGLLISCKNETKELAYSSYGKEITDTDALSSERLMAHFDTMKVGDTLNTKMKGAITEVCSKKGCWMKLDIGNDKIVRVTFKDYGFFMPLDATGEVVVNGIAYIKETSVADLKHYAEDAGKSAKEIAKITEPEVTMSFEADGVLLAN
ncbi:DUF4920 domain-containing protein [uncultured Winogradskyella sp.]|jgi:hypothetical protein|uniref:DUF4920 domain-containing protein n=1 Tax=uncultured Winogradskyella sp. TaxID=395353 RepID=UPI0025EE9DEE|nr:DUF4920 domain-containing protein [uncultured Winogradskyella sp.]